MTEFIAPVFTEFIWLLAGGLAGVLLALYLGVQAAQERPTAPVSWGLPLGLVVLAVVASGVAGLLNPDLWTGTMAALLMRWTGCLVALPFAGTWLLGLGLLAVRGAPRNVPVAGAVLLIAALVAVATTLEGTIGGNPVFGYVRAAIYLGLGVVSAVTALGTGSASGRGRAALMGSLVLPLLVALVESAERALVATLAMRHSSGLANPALRTEGLQRMLALVDGERPYGIAAACLACLVPLVVYGAHQRRVREPRVLLGLTVLVLVPLALWVGLPDFDTMVAAIEAKPR